MDIITNKLDTVLDNGISRTIWDIDNEYHHITIWLKLFQNFTIICPHDLDSEIIMLCI